MSRPRVYPSCPTHELLMHELAKESREITRVAEQWMMISGRRARHAFNRELTRPQPGLRLGVPHQDTKPRARKARTS